uniref:DUF2637 domain-containing protein n=1 Tax=Sphaerisporangium sp. CA-236357 TaxID=3240030 RepID=UPI003F496153
MSTYYDSRAARTVAAAEAEATRAEAEATRAEAEATRAETALRLEQARMQMAADAVAADRRDREARAATKAARRRLRRDEKQRARVARAAALRSGGRALAAAVADRAPLMLGGVAMSAPILLAWSGQMAFAREVMHLGALAPTLPIALEGSVWYVAYLTHRAIRAHLPIGRYRAATWVLACIAAGMNAWHGIQSSAKDGLQVGAALALASLLGIALWELTASLTARTESKRSAAEIRRAAWRRIRYPRLSYAAASIRAARGEACTVDEAWTAAWVDRYGVGPDSSRRDRRLARRIIATQRKADREAAKDGALTIVDGRIARPGAMTPEQEAAAAQAIAEFTAWQQRPRLERTDLPARTDVRRMGALDRTESLMLPVGPGSRTGSDRRTGDDRTEVTRTERTVPAARFRTEAEPMEKAVFIGSVREEILAAAERGDRWEPHYPTLMTQASRSKSWVEKAVREARLSVIGAEATKALPAGNGEPGTAGIDVEADARTDAEAMPVRPPVESRTDGHHMQDDQDDPEPRTGPVRGFETRTDDDRTGDTSQDVRPGEAARTEDSESEDVAA